MGYKLKRIMMRVNNTTRGLPAEYQEVEYIESSGTQYITTNIIPSNTKGIYIKLSSQDVSNDLLYIGSKKTGDTRLWIGNVYDLGANNIYIGWNTNTYYTGATANTIYEIKMNYLNDRKKQVDDTVVESNIGTLSSSNDVPIAIFAGNENGNIITPSKIKLYSCQITDSNSIVNDFVPCYRKADGEAGLYDLVNDQFYTNNGTGTFTKGSDVPNMVEKQVRPSETVLFDFGDWTNSEWTVGPSQSAYQGTVTKTSTYISFYNSNQNSSNYLSQYPIDGTKDFLLEFNANIPNTSLSYHSMGITTAPVGNNIDFHTNRESTYRNKIWCETYDGTTTVRQNGETNPGTADYFIKKEGNTLTMGRNGTTKYTTSNFPFASTYYLFEGVYRATATIYTAKLTYL